MASVLCSGYLRTNTRDQIPVEATLAESTEGELTTDPTFTVTAQSIGNYKVGSTITGGNLYGKNNVAYCYVLRQGVVLGWMLPNVFGVTNKEEKFSAPINLRAGDTLRMLALAAATRTCTLLVKTASGVSRIFTGTPSGAGTTNLLDIQDGTPIGDVLQGQTIVMAAALSIDDNKLDTSCGSVLIRNASGQLAGAIPVSNPTKAEPMISMVNIPIALNFTASVITSA